MLIDLALYSGLRVGEMAALKVGDISFKEPDPFIIVRHGKGNKKRTVYIDLKLTKHLKEFINYKAKTLKQSIDSYNLHVKTGIMFCDLYKIEDDRRLMVIKNNLLIA